jgi:hypothetical protein
MIKNAVQQIFNLLPAWGFVLFLCCLSCLLVLRELNWGDDARALFFEKINGHKNPRTRENETEGQRRRQRRRGVSAHESHATLFRKRAEEETKRACGFPDVPDRGKRNDRQRALTDSAKY